MLSEYDLILETLSNPNADWKAREDLLRKLGKRCAEGRPDAFDFLNVRGAKPLALQLSDIRSGIVKFASEAVVSACDAAAASKVLSLEKFAEGLLRDPNLYKGVGSANKVIAGHVGSAMMALFERGAVPFGSLDGLLTVAKSTKNPQIRERIAQSIAVFVENMAKGAVQGERRGTRTKTPTETLAFLKKSVEFFLRDASGGVRGFAKQMKKALEKVDEAVFAFAESTADLSRETADELTPTTNKQKRATVGSVASNVSEGSVVLKKKVETLARGDSEDLNGPEEFRMLLKSFEISKNIEVKKETVRLLEKIEFSAIGPQAIKILVENAVPMKLQLKFLIAPCIKMFKSDHFAKVLLDTNEVSAAILLREKLTNSSVDELFENLKRPSSFALIELLCSNITSVETPNMLKTMSAELLISLSTAKDFTQMALQVTSFPAIVRFITEKGFPNSERLTQILTPKSPNVAVHSKSPAPQLTKSQNTSQPPAQVPSPAKTLSIEAQLKMASPAARKKILLGIQSNLSILDPQTPSQETEKILAKATEALNSIAEVSLLDVETLSLACKAAESIAKKKPSHELMVVLLQVMTLLFKKNAKDIRDVVCESVVGFGSTDALLTLMIEKFEEKEAETNELIDSIKFLIGFLKAAQASYAYEMIKKELRPHLPEFFQLIKEGIFTHKEVVVRKTVVQLFVQFYHFFGQDVYSKEIQIFSLEQQKLIQVYIKKSLE